MLITRSLVELLDELNTLDEHTRIEAKAARDQVGKSILETVSAFSNEPGMNGGYILLGVIRQPDGHYTLEGVSDPDTIQQDFVTKCGDPDQLTPPIHPHITVESIKGRVGVVAYIPEAPPTLKPVHLTKPGLPRGAFRRSGSTDQRCTQHDLQEFFQARSHLTFDTTPVREATIDDIDYEAVKVYRRAREKANPTAAELDLEDNDLLRSIRCLFLDGDRLVPTIAGLILFGTARALRQHLPMARIDYSRVPGTRWITDADESFQSAEFLGPLFKVIPRLRANILADLPRMVSLPERELQRQEKPRIPDRVIREALVNAVMHRNYQQYGPVQIIHFSDRLEFRNPGYSLIPVDQLGELHSETRNPTIAAALHDTLYAENKGTGIGVMRQKMKEVHLSLPRFDSSRQKNTFTAAFMFHNLLDDADLSWVKRLEEHNLSEAEVRILHLALENEQITNEQCRKVTGLEMYKVSVMLRRLSGADLLVQHKHGARTFYVASPLLVEVGGVRPVGSEFDRLLSDLPPRLQYDLGELGSRSKSVEHVQRLVVEICSVRPFTVEEIALLLDRGKPYVQSNYITPLLEKEDLEWTSPEERQALRPTRRARPQEARARRTLDDWIE